MPEETLETKLDRPFHYDGTGPHPIKQYHHMKSRKIFTKLLRVEQEITEKLQKLKMECFGDGTMNGETQTGLSNCVYKHEKPVRMYYQAIDEKSNYFEIPKSSEAFSKLWQEELEIIENLHKLKKSTNSLLMKLHKGRQHGSNNLVKERQLIKRINKAKGEVEKISANSPSPSEPVTRIYTWRGDILDTKEALTDYIKVTTSEVKELRMKQMTYRAYDGRAELEKAATEKEITILERKLENVKQKKVQVSKLQLIKKIQVVVAVAELHTG